MPTAELTIDTRQAVPSSPPEPMLPTAQVCAEFSVHRRTLRGWIRSGVFPPPVRFGAVRRWNRSVIDKVKVHGWPLPVSEGGAAE
jgi:predicted DNA-binding transcriptional regulator AlpA